MRFGAVLAKIEGGNKSGPVRKIGGAVLTGAVEERCKVDTAVLADADQDVAVLAFQDHGCVDPLGGIGQCRNSRCLRGRENPSPGRGGGFQLWDIYYGLLAPATGASGEGQAAALKVRPCWSA